MDKTVYIVYELGGPVKGPHPRTYNSVTGKYDFGYFYSYIDAKDYVVRNTCAGGKFAHKKVIIVLEDENKLDKDTRHLLISRSYTGECTILDKIVYMN